MGKREILAANMAALLLVTGAAAAIEPVRGGVRDVRDAHEWLAGQPRGAGREIAGIRFQPTLPINARYDDSIFASERRDVDDVIFGFNPSLLARARPGRHEFAASLYSRTDIYADHSRQDNSEFGAGVSARITLTDWLAFSLQGHYDDLHEDWDSPDVPLAAAEQVELEQLSGAVGAHLQTGRFSADLSFAYSEVDVDDVPARGGGVIDLIGRHRDTVDIALELGWQFNDHLKPFVRYRWNDHGYDQAPPRVLVDRDGDGRAIVGGVEIVFERQLRARLYGGHMMQDFDDDDPNLEQADGIGYGAEVDWQVAPETQLRFDALREIEEASEGFESGRFASTVRLRASHRLSDRLSLAAALGYVRRNYVGTTREADTWSGRIGATWQLPLNLYTTLGWRYSERDSTVSGRSYARHVALLEFGWRP